MATNPPSFINVAQRLRVGTEQYYAILRQALCGLRVAMPGVVQSFDPVKQTVVVQPAIRERINQDLVPTDVDLPQLLDVPILLYRGGGYAMTLPIQAGDECLVVFADMCIDAWYQSGGTANAQVDKRRHDLSDAIAVFGIWSQPRVLANYSPDTVQLRTEDGTSFVEINGHDINVSVQSTGVVNISSQGSNINVLASGSGKVEVHSDTEIDIDAPAVKLTGGGASIDAKNFLAHKHSGVSTGGGQTGGVV